MAVRDWQANVSDFTPFSDLHGIVEQLPEVGAAPSYTGPSNRVALHLLGEGGIFGVAISDSNFRGAHPAQVACDRGSLVMSWQHEETLGCGSL